ncbi:MAG: pentapeptide repeat-containing protein [Leptolyngbyaceae cyanobacterium HOT.MB2.61]|nr:pentapeptide repeat-containing protein [Leptolyngbyaceae cyanobacterium HOT.MB2.61]
MQILSQKDLELDKKKTSDKSTISWRERFFAWTGFGEKKLWDLLQFVCTAAIPVILSFYSCQQEVRNEDNQRHKIMTDYLDAMTELLIRENIQSSNQSNKNGDTIRNLAQARTLNTLRQLDGEKKGQLIKFLYEASLVRKCQFNPLTGRANTCHRSTLLRLRGARLDNIQFDSPVPMPGIDLNDARLPKAILPEIDLTDAQLKRATLIAANLNKAFLAHAQMNSANLQDANLVDAILKKADLTNALLMRTNLGGADLSSSILNGANLNNANLNSAELEGADLRNANLIGASLEGTNLKGVEFNDRTQFPVGFSKEGRGMRKDQ